MNVSSNNCAVIGSNLRIDAHLIEIESLLRQIVSGLKQAANDYRECASDEDKVYAMQQLFGSTNNILNSVLVHYREVNDLRSCIATLAHGELSTNGLDRAILKGYLNINATDEGFAEMLAWISSLSDAGDRLEATHALIDDIQKSIKSTSSHASSLSSRMSYDGVGLQTENANEGMSARSLQQMTKDNLAILEKRLGIAIELFFKYRAECLLKIDSSTKMVARIYPNGTETTRTYARTYDASQYANNIILYDDTFKNPRHVISRVGRQVKSRKCA